MIARPDLPKPPDPWPRPHPAPEPVPPEPPPTDPFPSELEPTPPIPPVPPEPPPRSSGAARTNRSVTCANRDRAFNETMCDFWIPRGPPPTCPLLCDKHDAAVQREERAVTLSNLASARCVGPAFELPTNKA